MTLIIISFIAGVLTVLAPCILPLLPVILAGSLTETKNRRRPFIIIAALSVSVFVFTLLLKGTTALISVQPSFWSYVSAAILLAFGLTLLFPETWARIVLKIPGHNKPDSWISKGYSGSSSVWSDILVGAALGPVFTTCSPTFFVILATVLPQSLGAGLLNLAAYIIGLALILLLIAHIGQRFVDRLEWASNPYGWFKKILGILFIVLAVLIAFGWDKKIETALLDSGFFDVTRVEQSIKQTIEGLGNDKTKTDMLDPVFTLNDIPAKPFHEIVKPAGFVNSEPFKLGDLVGKKVILIDFVAYSCINCQRTFPYLNDWYNKYKDQGLEIVGIHTPEFSFEKDKENVAKAAQEFGLKFPLVLDNDYGTWNAYANSYWPRKYLIDIHGNIIYDHIGEGNYEETEKKIVEALNDRKKFLAEAGTVKAGVTMPAPVIQARSPETYFGASRNKNFGNGRPYTVAQGSLTIPASLSENAFYLGGEWKVEEEFAENISVDSQVSYVFNASNMYLVAQSADGSTIEAKVLIDGKPISAEQSGADVVNGALKINSSRLYHLFKSTSAFEHRIDIIFSKPKVRIFTFTFG